MIMTCSVNDLLRTNLSLELKLHLFLIFFHLLASPVLGGDMLTTVSLSLTEICEVSATITVRRHRGHFVVRGER